MVTDEIKKFYSIREDYFKKKLEISKAMLELDFLLKEANAHLASTIDNGFTNERLVKVANEYAKMKFRSKQVQKFLDDVDSLLMADVDPKLKENLEVAGISLLFSGHSCYGTKDNNDTIGGPIRISYIDNATGRSFTLVIPIKTGVHTDLINWEHNHTGLYVVSARVPGSNEKDICTVFDSTKVSKAIAMLLDGKLDDEIKTEFYIFNNAAVGYRIFKENARCNPFVDDEPKMNINFIEMHDLFDENVWSTRSLVEKQSAVKSCIDDRKDFLPKNNKV